MAKPLVIPDATVGNNEDQRRATTVEIATARKIEDTAANVDLVLIKRAFAAGIPLMAYASLRFAGFQRLRPREAGGFCLHIYRPSQPT